MDSDQARAGKLASMGGKDVMLAGDPAQAQPIVDESGHEEGAYKMEGGWDAEDRSRSSMQNGMRYTRSSVSAGINYDLTSQTHGVTM